MLKMKKTIITISLTLLLLNLISSIFIVTIINNKFLIVVDAQSSNALKYCYKFQWGSEGEDDGQFLRPHDVAFDSKGFVYINDRERNDIQKFTPDGKFIEKFGGKGEKLGEFKSPYSMAIIQRIISM